MSKKIKKAIIAVAKIKISRFIMFPISKPLLCGIDISELRVLVHATAPTEDIKEKSEKSTENNTYLIMISTRCQATLQTDFEKCVF